MPSEAIEDYLKAIYKIQQNHERVTTSLVAERLGVSPASTTAMIKKLARQNLVTYERYQGVSLTVAGRKIALEIIRHHRLIELYLQEALGVPWDRVHEEAERWEHVLSEDLEDRIDEILGHPTVDPHGSPIPSRSGTVQRHAAMPLLELQPGATSVVVEVRDHSPELLRYLTTLGIALQTPIHVIKLEPFDGPLLVKVGDQEHHISRVVAGGIFVATEESANSQATATSDVAGPSEPV